MNTMTFHSTGPTMPTHRPQNASPSGLRRRRILGGGVVAILTAVAVALPAQASAATRPEVATSTALAASQVGGATTALQASAAYGDFRPAKYERRLHNWANRVRDRFNVRSLSLRTCHNGFAVHWSHHLVKTGEFRHQDLGNYMSTCNLTKAGEILALGSVSPHKMIRMWLGSPEHRALLLDGSFRLAGIGARQRNDGAWIGTIDFGRH